MFGVSMGRDDVADSPRLISRRICAEDVYIVEFRAIPHCYRNLVLDIVGNLRTGVGAGDQISSFSIQWNQLTMRNGSFVGEVKVGNLLWDGSIEAQVPTSATYGTDSAVMPGAGSTAPTVPEAIAWRMTIYDYATTSPTLHPSIATAGSEFSLFGSFSRRALFQTAVYRGATTPFSNYSAGPVSSLQIGDGFYPWAQGTVMTLWGEP